MQQVHAGTGPHRRPILLFPEGTTTNGNFLLRFRTGAFIAGVPVQPTIVKYGPVSVESDGAQGALHGAQAYLRAQSDASHQSLSWTQPH